MPKPILYLIHLSPPCRTVELCAKALDVELELKEVNLLGGEHLKPEFLKLNPQHTVPVLDDSGTIVCESHAIVIYLASKYGKDSGLYPKDLVEQTKVNAALFFEGSMLFPRMRAIFEPIFYNGGTEIPTEKVEYMQKSYKLLEDTVISIGLIKKNTRTSYEVFYFDPLYTLSWSQLPNYIQLNILE